MNLNFRPALRLLLPGLNFVVLLCSSSALPANDSSARRRAPPATLAQQPASSTAVLTPQERRGKAIYQRGVSPSGREIVAVLGDINIPASTLSCAGCHGARGEGKTEGGITAGELTWFNLTKPYGHIHPSGRKHGPFDDSSLARLVVSGIDPAGNALPVIMPRYRLTQDEVGDLITYLKRIEADRDPGVTERTIRVGSVLPTRGPLADAGAAMRDVLTAYFNDLNDRGGIYNRKIELRVVGSGADADPAAAAAAVGEIATRDEIFAFVGGVSAGADAEFAAVAAEREIPFIAPSTLLTQTGTPAPREVFYLLPGVAEQARALVNFAASKPDLARTRVAIIAAEGNLASPAAIAATEQAKKSGWVTVDRHAYKLGALNAAQLVLRLRQDGTDVIFFFGHGSDDLTFIAEAAAAAWTPHVLLLGQLTSQELVSSAPQSFSEKLFLALPTAPEDITRDGMAEFRALREKYKFAPRHTSSQFAAFAAAKVFAEALKRAGRELTREKLIAALESLYDFDTGVTPLITFGPNRRVGAAGARIVSLDVAKKQFVSSGGWVNADR